MQHQRLKHLFYLACAIEQVAGHSSAQDWKKKIRESLNSPEIGVYDPIEQEEAKTGKPSGEMCAYLKGVKQGGKWKQFYEGMNRIWWGATTPKMGFKIEMLKEFRKRAIVDGNYREDFSWYGDYEAVCRSTAVIAYIEKNVRTVGTICELHTAYLLDIPVLLILPDQTKTEANSTLISISQNFYDETDEIGQIFSSIESCAGYIKKVFGQC